MPRDEMDFSRIIERLQLWRDDLEPQLHDPSDPEAHAQAVSLKRQIASAVACLEFCQAHEITAARLREARVLPRSRDWMGDFRVMDAMEVSRPEDWLDPLVDGEAAVFAAYPGDFVL